jgi:Flp pilus assembly pilin Flp
MTATMVWLWVRLQLTLARMHERESGQELVEYALILALIVIVILTATRFLGGKVSSALSTVASQV